MIRGTVLVAILLAASIETSTDVRVLPHRDQARMQSGWIGEREENPVRALGPEYAGRMKSAEDLAGSWLEVKLPQETEA